MKIKKLFLFAVSVFLVSVFVLTSCKKKDDNNDNDPPVPQNNAGLGNNPGFPTGNPYTLPPHIILLEQIRGGISYGKILQLEKGKKNNLHFLKNEMIDDWQYYGSGLLVELCMKLYNTLSTDTMVLIPGGLIFIDSTKVYQHGFVLQTVTIPIAAHDTAFAVVRAYCTNLYRNPSSQSAIYHFGPITNNSELTKIVNIMKTKQIPDAFNFPVINEIQNIIWDVTDFNKILTQEQINYLNSLP